MWSLIILYLSTKGGVNFPSSFSDLIELDKIGHAAFYCVLTVLLYRSMRAIEWEKFSSFAFSLVVASSYGILLEIVQYTFFPGRYFEVYDIVANIIGASLSWLIIRYFFI